MIGNYLLVVFLFLFGVFGLISTEIPKWVLSLIAIAAALAIAFGDGWKKKSMILFALLAWSTACFAQTNTNSLPGLSPTGQVDVVSLINLTIIALTPLVIQGVKKLIPKLPPFILNLLAPLLGAGIGTLLHAIGVESATGWGAAVWGGASTWLYEITKNVKEALKPPEPEP